MGKWPERLRNKSDAMQHFTADLVYAIIGSTIYKMLNGYLMPQNSIDYSKTTGVLAQNLQTCEHLTKFNRLLQDYSKKFQSTTPRSFCLNML